MHGCGSGSAALVNAEVDSMGGVVDGGVGVGIKTSPRRVAIEKAQAELRQEYDVREERRRELEFLEKGGNPLDFKFGNAASLSVQSTSFTDRHAEHFVNSEAKGSFALTASPHGDSVESIGRPGAPAICEPNTADNFDGENQVLQAERKSKQSSRRSTVAPSEQSGKMNGAQHAKESEDSAIFRPYARRNRSRPNRDGNRSSSHDVVQGSGAHGPSVRGASRDVKGFMFETNDQKNHTNLSLRVPKLPISNGDLVPQAETSRTRSNMEVDRTVKEIKSPEGNFVGDRSDKAELNLLTEKLDKAFETDTQKVSIDIVSSRGNLVNSEEHVPSASIEYPSSKAIGRTETEAGSSFEDVTYGNEGVDVSVAVGTKDSKSSYSPKNQGLEVIDLGMNRGTDDANVSRQTSDTERLRDEVVSDVGNKKDGDAKTALGHVVSSECAPVNQNHSGSSPIDRIDEEVKSSDVSIDGKCMANREKTELHNSLPSEVSKSSDNLNARSTSMPQTSMDNSAQGKYDHSSLMEKSSTCPDPNSFPDKVLKMANRAHEDSILEEARTIVAKRKRIAELSVLSASFEGRRKSHWDFVLEEMAWLANDFSQERLWKMTAAAQICHRAALTSRLRFSEQNRHEELKRVAHTLAKAVMQFWHSAQTLVNDDNKLSAMRNCKRDSKGSDSVELLNKFGELDKEKLNKLEHQHPEKASANAVQAYAVRFLAYNCSLVSLPQSETPDRVTDLAASEVSWDDQLTEVWLKSVDTLLQYLLLYRNTSLHLISWIQLLLTSPKNKDPPASESLFYVIPSGAMLTYRSSIESHLVLCEKTGSSLQEEVDTSVHDVAADICYADNLYNEEEGETNTYYLHGDPDSMSKHDQKKQKSFTRTFSSRSYEPGSEMPFGHCNIGSQQSTLGKRPPNNYVGPVPPKRSRTASRQRVVGPFNPGASGALQTPTKTDASSGDTSSFQDDLSTLHCGSQLQKSVEVESVGEIEKQLPYDYTETTKPRKKKKAKHLGSSYEQGWQLDSVIPNDQRDSSKKRSEGHHFDSNGTSGLYGPPAMKKLKVVKQPMDGTLENMAPMAGSIPSPAASQMSNMSNTNKFIKIFNGRERGRKSKSLKISAGQSGQGSPWSVFEEQALVVLVHDMGPNWELVSDAINSTIQFKCIFRKPKECKERHKFLMDKGAGDGPDSAEDSGSSQSYPSTLPGIPKGSARQLFQRLQGPMEEDTLKSHFEKIIMIGKKKHFRRNQNDHLDGKQPVPPHNSHVIALSQVCTKNLNGRILTPLDLCDASPASADGHPIGYQGSHGNNLGMPNQGVVAPVLPTSAANGSLQGTSGVVIGNHSPSPSGPVNPTTRDDRYNGSRTPLPVEEQQRLQQMLSARGLPQPGMSASGHLPGADRGVRMLSGGNGMGVMSGVNRNMPIPRPGFQGMTSSPMLNSGLIFSAVAGVQNPLNSQAGSVTGSGNSMMRSRDALQIMRPGNVEHQRRMISPEHQMQTTPGNGQEIPSFNGLSSAYGNQTIPSPGPTYPGHQPHHHQMSPQQSHVLSSPHHPHLQGLNHTPTSQQQAYAFHRLAKERQLQQQRFAQQQQQQFSAAGALVPRVQAQTQLPISSSMPNSNQNPVQPSSQAVSAASLTPSSPMNPASVPQQQKHNFPHHGIGRSMQAGTGGLTNQVGKQRRQPTQQQFQQPGRHHPQQRQHSQPPQNSKVSKGMGKGNMVHQNLAIDHTHLNGLSLPQGNQGSEKGEQGMHLLPGQGMVSGPGLGGVQTSRSTVASSSNHSQSPQKLFSSPTHLSKQPNSDSSCQSQVLPVTSSHALSSSHQAASLPSVASNLQHLRTKSHQKQSSQSHPNVQRIIHPSHQASSDMPTKSHSDQGHSDQQLTSDIGKPSIGTSAVIPQACSDSTTDVPISPTAQQRDLPETVISDSATQPISGPLTHSGGNEAVVAVNQGLGQMQLSGGLPQHGHGALTKVIPSPQVFHPQEQQLQQEHHSPRKQPPLQQHPQQQMQQLPSAQGSTYTGVSDSKLE